MDVTELMFGDIVEVVDGDKGCYARVAGILEELVYFDALGWVDKKFVRPVSLSVGFLQRNGFFLSKHTVGREEHVRCTIFPEDGKVLTVEFYKDRPVITVVKTSSVEYSDRISYVHKLQRVISFCGMHREIVI